MLKKIQIISFVFFVIVLFFVANSSKNNNVDDSQKQITQSSDNKNYVVVDTNQHSCYSDTSSIKCPQSGDYFGQDAQYRGKPFSYLDNGDGTITDLNTGLMWIKDAGDKQQYYDALNRAKNFSFAGYNDWRVPTIKELYSLMDFSGTEPNSTDTSSDGLKPFIDTDYFVFNYGDLNSGSRIIDSQWVTSSVYTSKVMDGQECFFGVNFADGRIKCYPTSAGHNNGWYLRMVRGNSEYGENKFVDNNNGTITDKSTGLLWQKEDGGKGVLWKDALSYCENLSLAGESDWRLPNAKELQSIVDYNRSPDFTDSPAIDSIFSLTQITNEGGKKDWGYYWTSTTHRNSRGSALYAVYISFGRALGYMKEFGGWVDVHGAGAQRSDPKIDESGGNLPEAPQGDARRFYNYVRCVSGGAVLTNNTTLDIGAVGSANNTAQESTNKKPPQESINACLEKEDNSVCSFETPSGTLKGNCLLTPEKVRACVPN